MSRSPLLVAVLMAVVLFTLPLGQTASFAQAAPNSTKVAALDMTLRNLFVDHVFWVRSMVIATKAGNAAEATVAYRQALGNAKAFGGAVASFYGEAAGQQFATLFAGHVNAVRNYCLADLKGDEAAENAAAKAMTQNGEALATFLSTANHNLPKDAVLSLLGSHVALHIAECNAAAAGKLDEEAGTWDPMLKNIDTISDALAQAIAKQFPSKFM